MDSPLFRETNEYVENKIMLCWQNQNFFYYNQ